MADSKNMQVIGTEEPLKDSPRSMERKPFGGGQIQAVGSQAPLKTTPTPDQFMNKNVKNGGGEIQCEATKVSLSNTPRRGWQSAPGGMGMNERASFMNKIQSGGK